MPWVARWPAHSLPRRRSTHPRHPRRGERCVTTRVRAAARDHLGALDISNDGREIVAVIVNRQADVGAREARTTAAGGAGHGARGQGGFRRGKRCGGADVEPGRLSPCRLLAVAQGARSSRTSESSRAGGKEKFWTHPDGTKFHYFEMGQRATPVILIHGSGGTALNWMAERPRRQPREDQSRARHRHARPRADGRARWQAPAAHAEHGSRCARIHGRHGHSEGAHRRLLDGRIDHEPAHGARAGALHHRALRRIGRARGTRQRVREDDSAGPERHGAARRRSAQAVPGASGRPRPQKPAWQPAPAMPSQLSSQPVPAAVPRPHSIQGDTLPDPRGRWRIQSALHAHPPTLERSTKFPAGDPGRTAATSLLVHGGPLPGSVPGTP